MRPVFYKTVCAMAAVLIWIINGLVLMHECICLTLLIKGPRVFRRRVAQGIASTPNAVLHYLRGFRWMRILAPRGIKQPLTIPQPGLPVWRDVGGLLGCIHLIAANRWAIQLIAGLALLLIGAVAPAMAALQDGT